MIQSATKTNKPAMVMRRIPLAMAWYFLNTFQLMRRILLFLFPLKFRRP